MNADLPVGALLFWLGFPLLLRQLSAYWREVA